MTEEEYIPSSTDTVDDDLAHMTDEDHNARTEAYLAGLQQYDLEEDDHQILAGFEDEEAVEEVSFVPPVVAIVGRPNVGKSTLVNRIIGRRQAVVEDVSGVTRDRVFYDAEWNGKPFTVADTGGWEYGVKGLDAKVADQAERAVDVADAVVFVVDATVGITATDEAIVTMLRKARKPIILAANKVDGQSQEADAAGLWGLGFGYPYPVSGLHGRGAADLLDSLVDELPEESAYKDVLTAQGPRRVAIVGRPNVGKSSLLNNLAGANRAVVDELAGTTRDPVDELVDLDGQIWEFIDTAGIRRRQHMASGSDYYASLRTRAALDRAEVAVVLLEASQPLSEQDVRIIQMVLDSGRAMVLAFNKWDLLHEDRRDDLEREIDLDFQHVAWAPRINISAKTGWHKNRLVPALETALDSWETRIPTGQLNSFIGELVAAHPHPVRGGKQPRILFATQSSTRPPKFILFTTGFLEPGYRRFITNRLRQYFGFQGSPIEITMRVRERRRR
ncbi:hypothetical protein GCM10009720_06960 [Yaniella flava]|uniref:GTPase Der n=1 Tax=Yaniella flava TaxID=287930 RepID=A0ABP5FMB7_9MICC